MTPTVYAWTRDGLFKSTDGATHWEATDFPQGILGLAFDPVTPATLYAFGDQGVFKSVDGGAHWMAVDPGFPHVHGCRSPGD